MSLNFLRKCASYLLCPALLVSIMPPRAGASCTDNCSISVNFTGNYTEETCEVAINNASSNESVELPVLSVTTLKKSGDEAGSRPFDVTLKECPANRTIVLYFISSVSPADSITGNLMNDTGFDYSKNVQIRIRKEDESQVVIDNAATGQKYVTSSAGDALTHRFSANYYAKGNAAATVGRIHAAAGIVLVYK